MRLLWPPTLPSSVSEELPEGDGAIAARMAFIGLKLKLTTMPVTATSRVPKKPGVSDREPILPSVMSNGKNESSSSRS